MDELQSKAYGFDFRGPASSEMLNEFAENLNKDMGSMLATAYRLKHEMTMLSGQTLKQTHAFARVLNRDTTRDSGSNCKADLADATVLLTTDRDGTTIPAADRMVHYQPYGILTCPVQSQDYLTYSDGQRKFVQPGVTMAIETDNESGTVYLVPIEYAIAGLPGMFYERILETVSVKAGPQMVSLFFSIPASRAGSGYNICNYLRYMPFPVYSEGVRVYYTLDPEPELTRAGSNWNDWLSYLDSLHHGTVYFTEQAPVFTAFPGLPISAIRIDLSQPYYLVEDAKYVYSSGLGGVGLGIMKSTSSSVKGTVTINKPSGNFISVGTTDGNVVFDNVDSGEEAALCSTYAWVDPVDTTKAYVEVTLTPGVLAGGHVPIIKEVNVDYT